MARQRGLSPAALEVRFRETLARLVPADADGTLVVAVSGGMDSVVLLHLLTTNAPALGHRLVVAHLDHAMREGSAGDLLWVRGLCAAWGLPIRDRRLPEAPTGEGAARTARYAFLREVAGEEDAAGIVTAHHADDQAETVLFRALRGTGLHGLRGIPERGAAGVIRPLLSLWRRDLARYARAHHLRWRTDPTNLSTDPARNFVRHRVLPQVERHFAPSARRHLVALAAEAAEAEAALERLDAEAERTVISHAEGVVLLARTPLLGYDSATAARLLRRSLRRFGTVLSRAGTRSALQFITDASSGREHSLPGGVVLRVEFDTIRVERRTEVAGDRPLEIARPEPGTLFSATCRIGGAEYRVTAGVAGPEPAAAADGGRSGWSAAIGVSAGSFPLRVRGWCPGDRVRTAGGGKSLKKLFLEQRIPRSDRHRLPVVEDAGGSIVWVAGVGRPIVSAPDAGAETVLLRITHA